MVTPSKGRTHGPGKIIVRLRNDGINSRRVVWRTKFHRSRLFWSSATSVTRSTRDHVERPIARERHLGPGGDMQPSWH
jgi:hypothetical protein